MERYIEMFGPTLIVALGVIASLGAALHYVFGCLDKDWFGKQKRRREPEPDERDWHPSRHYRGNDDA